MHAPSTELLALLARLGLAAPAEVQAVARRARKLAKGLPLFDSVWVDALAQAGTLTPYQAAEINAGRAERLAVGPFILCRPLTCTPYADVFHAIERQTRSQVRLLLTWLTHGDRDAAADQMDGLLGAAPRLAEAGVDHVHLAALEECDPHLRFWAATASIDGVSVADCQIASGRLTPTIVLEIARQMVADLRVLERFGLVHGDLAPAALVLGTDGRVHMPHPGVRPIVRPEEGYGRLELAPAAYESLAPERIVEGTPPDVQSELFACGCLWWQLLSGRSPIAGGDALTKLNNIRAGRIPDVMRMAPETPPQLAAVISRCVNADPARRGDSFAELQAQLGPSTRDGRQTIADAVRAHRNPPRTWITRRSPPRLARRISMIAAGAAGCAVALGIVSYPIWTSRLNPAQVDTTSSQKAQPMVAPRAAASANPDSTGSTGTGKPEAELPHIVQATYQEDEVAPSSMNHTRAQLQPPQTAEDALILESGHPIAAETLQLRPGRIVRGRNGAQAQVHVRGAGMLLTVSDVQFENVDFIYQQDDSTDHNAAIVRLAAARVSFRGCTFRPAAPAGGIRIAAVRCQAGESKSAAPLPRSVYFERCRLTKLLAAVDVHGELVLSIQARQSLLTDVAALLRQDAAAFRQPTLLTMTNVTLRHCDSVMTCAFAQLPARGARIAVTATDCVLAPDQGIFQLLGPQPPQPLLKLIQWTGAGSLLEEKAPVVVWRTATDPAAEVLEDTDVAIDGLARSFLEFAGKKVENPADSRLVNWTAPVGGSTPPGVDVSLLPDHAQ